MNIELKLKCGSDGPFGAPTSCVEVEIASPLANQIELALLKLWQAGNGVALTNIKLKLKCGSDGPFGAPASCEEVEIASPTAKKIDSPRANAQKICRVPLGAGTKWFCFRVISVCFFLWGHTQTSFHKNDESLSGGKR